MNEIGSRLRALRLSVDFSQFQIAERLNTSQVSIFRYESGRATPPVNVLLWYADFFQVSLDYIFGRTDQPQGITYSAEPKIIESQPKENKELQQFIDMCFTPNSPMQKKLKATLLKMMEEEQG